MTDERMSEARRLSTAKQFVHACVAALPTLASPEFVCVIMHERDRLARSVGAHIARAAGDEPDTSSSIHGRPAPVAIVLELRKELGDRLTRRLEAPVPQRHMRVLWLAPSDRRVFDVAVDVREVAAVADQLERGDDVVVEDDPASRVTRDVSGTWRDPTHYLPMPVPAGWEVGSLDTIGVLRVFVDGRLVLEMGAMEPQVGRILFVVLRAVIGEQAVTDDEVRRVLDRLRNVERDFKELRGFEEIFGTSRVWGARVLESVALGRA